MNNHNSKLSEIKEYLRENWEHGVDCPACGQLVKLYSRKLNTGMAIFLIGLYKLSHNDGSYHHASEVSKNNKSLDYSVLRHWGLIEPSTQIVDGKRQSGFWRITRSGIEFVLGMKTVPSHVNLFNNKFVGFSDDRITIDDALGKNFNYQELMNG